MQNSAYHFCHLRYGRLKCLRIQAAPESNNYQKGSPNRCLQIASLVSGILDVDDVGMELLYAKLLGLVYIQMKDDATKRATVVLPAVWGNNYPSFYQVDAGTT